MVVSEHPAIIWHIGGPEAEQAMRDRGLRLGPVLDERDGKVKRTVYVHAADSGQAAAAIIRATESIPGTQGSPLFDPVTDWVADPTTGRPSPGR